MPPHIAAFDLAENEFRGRTVCTSLDQVMLDVMIGKNGKNLPMFFNAMLGGKGPPDPYSCLPQIGYRTPGQLTYDIRLSINDEEKDFRDSHGCWDVTDAISTFSPTDFSYYEKGVFINEEEGSYIDAEAKFMDPVKRRHITQPGAPQYKPEVEVRDMLKRSGSKPLLSEVIHTIKSKYPNTVCFIIVSACVGIKLPERPINVIPEQPPAYTHYALQGRARGDPSSLPESLYGRVVGEVPFPYLDNRNDVPGL